MSRRFQFSLLVLLIGTAIGGAFLAGRGDKHGLPDRSTIAKAHPAEARAVLAAANAFWDEKMSEYGSEIEFFSGTEGIHLWSCRIMEAERALADTKDEDQAAVLSHWQRMDSAYRQVKALFVAGVKGGEADRFAAAVYYRAEAELWLVAAGGRVPQDRDTPDGIRFRREQQLREDEAELEAEINSSDQGQTRQRDSEAR